MTKFYGLVTNETKKSKNNFSKKYGYSNYGLGYGKYGYYSTYENYNEVNKTNNNINDPNENDDIKESNNYFINPYLKVKKRLKFLLNWLEN